MLRGIDQLLHLLRHDLNGSTGFFEVEGEQNARDFVELGRRFGCLGCFLRMTEKVVQRLFDFTNGGTRFGNNLSHAALIVEPRVQRFHPLGGRLHLFAALHGLEPLGQQGNAFVERVVIARGFFQRSFQEQDGRRHFHGHFGMGGLFGLDNVLDDRLQSAGEGRGSRPQGVQFFWQAAGVVAQRLDFVRVAGTDVRPQILERSDGITQLIALGGVDCAI